MPQPNEQEKKGFQSSFPLPQPGTSMGSNSGATAKFLLASDFRDSKAKRVTPADMGLLTLLAGFLVIPQFWSGWKQALIVATPGSVSKLKEDRPEWTFGN